MADDVNTMSSGVDPPKIKQLFPIGGIVSPKSHGVAPRSLFPSVAVATVDEKEGRTSDLGWLRNESFKSEDAIAIARLHEKNAESDQGDAKNETIRQEQTVEVVETLTGRIETKGKKKHKTSRYASSPSEDERHKEAKVRKSTKSHRKRHSDSGDKDASDDRKKRKSRKDGHHKKKHKRYSSDSYSDDERERTKKSSKHKKSTHKHKKHSHHRETRHDISKPIRESKPEAVKPSTIWIEETNLKFEDAFREDKKSDRDNLAFKTLYYLHVARYRRLGKSCLGQQSGQVIDWTDSKEKEKEKKKKRKLGKGRYYGKDAVWSLMDGDAEVIELYAPKLEDERGGHARSSDLKYIPLEISMGEVNVVRPRGDHDGRTKIVDPLGIHDAATQNYLEGKGKEKMEDISSRKLFEDKQREAKDKLLKKKTAEFNRKTCENPHDIATWLEFVKFQDEVARKGVFGTDEAMEGERKKKTDLAMAEKKMAILEKAIEKNPTSIALKTEHLELCQEFWSAGKINEHWQQMAFQHPNDPSLWQQYLMFSQSSFSTFTFSKILKLYGKCLSTLSSVVEGTFQSHTPLPHTEEYMLDLFVQECEYIRQAGYVEKAIAAFQAMVEFNCFCPMQLEESTKASAQIAFFETFWDSEEPKIGEKGAKGWNKWMHKKEKGGWEEVVVPQQTDEEESGDEEDDLIKVGDPLWRVWHRLENTREQHHWLPWKPDAKKGETEDDCEDPDRLVLFDDFSSSLFKLSSPELKFHLVLRFLQFLGIATAPLCSSGCYQSQRHFLVSTEHPSQVLRPTLGSSGIGWKTVCQGVNCGIQSVHDGKKLNLEKSLHNHLSAEFSEFVTNMFSQTLSLFSGEARTHMTLIWIQYESLKAVHGHKKSRHQSKAVRKFAKSVLREPHNRNNLLLWETYAAFEWSAGNAGEARKVFDTALTLYSQLGKDSQSQSMKQAAAKLCHGYAELELGLDAVDRRSLSSIKDQGFAKCVNISNKNRALHIVSRFGEGGMYVSTDGRESVNSVTLLRARSAYQSEFQKTVESYQDCVASVSSEQGPNGSYAVHLVICFALFQYLTVGLQAAAVIFEEGMSAVRSLCQLPQTAEDRFNNIKEHFLLDYEILLTAYVKVNIYHMMHQPTALTPIRTLLQRALSDFPDSPAFMGFFIALEARSHIAGRVRRYFNHATHETNTPLPWLYAIYAEELRQQSIEEAVGNGVAGVNSKDRPTLPELTWQLPSTGITHRMRSLFERATCSRTARHSVLIWRMYIHFEVLHGNVERGKSIFYKALQHCPWSKAVYLDAIQYFPEDFLQIVDLMMEKEIRVRAPVEEVELLIRAKREEDDGEPEKRDPDPEGRDHSVQE